MLKALFRRFIFRYALAISLICILSNASLAFSEDHPRPRIGLVLGGGGALGLAHIGVLKILEDNHIPIDYVTGTSMGAIVGGLYATGKSSREIEDILKAVKWDLLFSDQPNRQQLEYRRKTDDRGFLGTTKFGFNKGNIVVPAGAIYGQNIDLLFAQLYKSGAGKESFDKLPIPFRAIGADIETGEAVVLKSGDLGRAARASMSVPGVFAPVEIDGKVLVDGGIANNLPMDQARDMGADILIVVNLPNDFQKRDSLQSAFAIAGQVLSFLLDQNAKRQMEKLTPKDVLIEPVLKGYTPTDFNKSEDLIKLGIDAGERAVSRLKLLGLNEDQYNQWRASLKKNISQEPPIEFVRIKNRTVKPDASILKALEIKIGAQLDRKSLEEKIQKEYNSQLYSQLRYEVVSDGDKKGIEVTAEERPWLQQYLRLGFLLSDNFQGESSYNLGASYRWTQLNSAGGEAEVEGRLGSTQRLYSEWYQPLAAGSPYFTSLSGLEQREHFQIFDDNTAVAKYRRNNQEGALAFGKTFSNLAELRFGVTRGEGSLKRIIGDPSLPQVNFETASLFTRLSLDTYDNASFPHNGNRLELKYTDSLEDLGASDSFQVLSGSAGHALRLGETFLIPGFAFARGLTELPRYNTFLNGGFFNFSGYQKGGLSNDGNVTGRLIAYHTLMGKSSGLLTSPIYGGVTFEAGQFWKSTEDDVFLTGGSVFVGADTPLLPAYLGIGYSEGGKIAGYFTVDRPF